MLMLFFTGLFAGTIDAIAGGGGLITLPVLFSLGVPPHLAFGTNKLQGTIGTLMATFRFYRRGFLSFNHLWLGLIFGFIGAVLGAVTTQILSSDILKKIIPVLLCIILLYTVFTPKLGNRDEKPRMKEWWFYLIFGLTLGFYDGFFGPGVGSFWVFSLTFLLGFNLIKATAYTKVFNLNSSLIAMVCFAVSGNIDYKIGLCMAAGQLIGGRLGANLAMTKGIKIIRPLFLIMVTGTIGSLVWRSYTSSDRFAIMLSHYGRAMPILLVLLLFVSFIFLYLRITRKQKTELDQGA